MLLSDILQPLDQLYRKSGNPGRAMQQAQYMRNQFTFYGLTAPSWRSVAKNYFRQYGFPDPKNLEELAPYAFMNFPREMHYSILWVYEQLQANLEANAIQDYEVLIQTQSWWDTVDHLAKLVGMLFQKYPSIKSSTLHRWLESDNMWLHRCCIIHQLHYKEQTDQAFLFDTIARFNGSKEFFIQKACGWALRQYAKTDPDAVILFVRSHELPALTVREALKHLKK